MEVKVSKKTRAISMDTQSLHETAMARETDSYPNHPFPVFEDGPVIFLRMTATINNTNGNTINKGTHNVRGKI